MKVTEKIEVHKNTIKTCICDKCGKEFTFTEYGLYAEEECKKHEKNCCVDKEPALSIGDVFVAKYPDINKNMWGWSGLRVVTGFDKKNGTASIYQSKRILEQHVLFCEFNKEDWWNHLVIDSSYHDEETAYHWNSPELLLVKEEYLLHTYDKNQFIEFCLNIRKMYDIAKKNNIDLTVQVMQNWVHDMNLRANIRLSMTPNKIFSTSMLRD